MENKSLRIAILILVHKNEKQVNRLIKHLSKNFDIYVHIDKRFSIKIEQLDNVFCFKQYKTYWGSFNIVLSILYLLKQAFNKEYDRYILISGQDLPLMTNQEIINFFKNNNNEYIQYNKMPMEGLAGNCGMDRLTKYWPNYYHFMHINYFFNIIFKCIRKIFNNFSLIFPRKIDYEFYKGECWNNLTNVCVKKIFEFLKINLNYISRFKYTNCSDEIFFQTIIKQLNGIKIINENLRYINWIDNSEHPKILRVNDYQKIMNSNKLFARKFDMDIDSKIINMVYDKINK